MNLETRLRRIERQHGALEGFDAVCASMTNLELADVVIAIDQELIDRADTEPAERQRLSEQLPTLLNDRAAMERMWWEAKEPRRPVDQLLRML